MTLFRVTAVAGVLIPLLTMSALAQTQQSVSDRAYTTLLQGAVSRELSATQAAIQWHDQMETLTQQIAAKDKQIADLTKERDALKAEKPTPEPAK